MKNEAYVLKLLNKLEAMGNKLIESYSWELDRKVMAHRDPAEYQLMLMKELKLSKQELLNKFVDYLKQPKVKKRKPVVIKEEAERLPTPVVEVKMKPWVRMMRNNDKFITFMSLFQDKLKEKLQKMLLKHFKSLN